MRTVWTGCFLGLLCLDLGCTEPVAETVPVANNVVEGEPESEIQKYMEAQDRNSQMMEEHYRERSKSYDSTFSDGTPMQGAPTDGSASSGWVQPQQDFPSMINSSQATVVPEPAR